MSDFRSARLVPVAALLAAAAVVTFVAAGAGAATGDELFARCETDSGAILIQFAPELAPRHVENFVRLSRGGFFDGQYFHRVIPGFVIQGGDPNTRNERRDDDGMGGPTWGDVLSAAELAQVDALNKLLATRGYLGLGPTARLKAEFSQTAKHTRGTLSMARANDPNSAGSQFFICVAEAAALDRQYTIFGRVVSGMDTVDRIVNAKRDAGDNPLAPIRIRKLTVIEGAASLTAGEREAWRKEAAGAGASGTGG